MRIHLALVLKKQKENENIYKMVNSSGANVVLVGVGCPKQEKWIDKHKSKMPCVDLWMALGATIDFEAGNIKRAPLIWRDYTWNGFIASYKNLRECIKDIL